MKKLLVLLLTVFALTSCEKDPEIIGIDAEKKLPKVEVSHYDADTDTWKTLSINENALKAHLGHGDFEGAWEGRKTYVPDVNFERYLICEGYDDEVNGYVFTANIIHVEEIYLNGENPLCDDEPGENHTVYRDLTGLEDFIGLKKLSLSETGAVFDVVGNSNLEEIWLFKYYLNPNLDFSKFTALTNISFNDCGAIESIDLQENSSLTSVFIKRNIKMEELDLSKNHNLANLSPTNINLLTSLNVQNGNNKNLTWSGVGINNLPNLCIQVDDAEWSEANWNVLFNGFYSEDCGS